MVEPLIARLWQLSEAGEPVLFLGRFHEPYEAALFDRLLERGVVQHAGRASAWDVCAACDCEAEERPIRQVGERLIAACPVDRSRDEVLAPDDLLTFRVDMAGLVRETAADTNLARPPDEVSPGVWRLGTLPDGRVLIVVPTRQAMLQAGLVGIIRLADQAGHIILLGPDLPESQRALLGRQGIQHQLLRKTLVAPGQSTPLALALHQLTIPMSKSSRLVIDRKARTVNLDRRPCVMTDQPFRLLLLLADAAIHVRGCMDARDIDNALYKGRARPNSREIRDIIRELRDGLASGLDANEAVPIRNLVKNARSPASAYQLLLTPPEIAILG